MKTNNIFIGIVSMIGLMFSKMESVFFGRNALMSKQAVDLLNDPKTKEDFIEFTTGIDAEGKRNEKVESGKIEKTFTKTNGETVTLVKFT